MLTRSCFRLNVNLLLTRDTTRNLNHFRLFKIEFKKHLVFCIFDPKHFFDECRTVLPRRTTSCSSFWITWSPESWTRIDWSTKNGGGGSKSRFALSNVFHFLANVKTLKAIRRQLMDVTLLKIFLNNALFKNRYYVCISKRITLKSRYFNFTQWTIIKTLHLSFKCEI